MNIFFIGSIRGGRAHQPKYVSIVNVLARYGTVHSGFVSNEALSHYGETRLADREIFERERSALEKSGVVVAETTTPSLGVGYLLACAAFLGKRVVALYHGEDTLKLSAMIKGDQGIEVYIYKTNEDIEGILAKVFAKA